MKTKITFFPENLFLEKRKTNSKGFLSLVMAGIVSFTTVIMDTGCKTHKAATSTSAADAKAKADAEAKKKADQEAAAKAAADAQAAAAKKEPYNRVENYFQQISNAYDVNAANQIINSALSSFKTADIPVLIIIYRNGATIDYDEPTTISKYLNYVKDQKRSPNSVDHLEIDSNGKITEVVLIKK